MSLVPPLRRATAGPGGAGGAVPLWQAHRIGAKEAFHRAVFERLVVEPVSHEDLVPAGSEAAAAVLRALARWIVEAPTGDAIALSRVAAVRATLRRHLRALGEPPGGFLQQAMAVSDAALVDPTALPAWKRLKLALLGDASLWTPQALDRLAEADGDTAHLAALVALDACPLDTELAARTAALGRWLQDRPTANIEIGAAPGAGLRLLPLLQDAAFHVSYLADPRRHGFKQALVRQAAQLLAPVALNLPEPRRAEGRRDGPRVTVVGELLFPGHAMHRCYADLLADLKAQAHVTLLAEAPSRSDAHADISHAQRYFALTERDPGVLAAQVLDTQPDIVLYPSIGMSYWTFVLSLLRLAPLQLMAAGHPAPACSPHIDGLLVFEDLAHAPLPHHARPVVYGRQPLPQTGAKRRPVGDRPAGAPPVVAVHAAAMKLNAGFLDALAEILVGAPDGTELHFFPNVDGLELAALRSDLRRRFPQAQVHAIQPYAAYVEELARADLVLQSFPFGGTNTAMDALALGVPMLCLDGDDLASRVDPLLLRRAGLGALCAPDAQGYIELGRQLLADPLRRQQLADRALDAAAALQRLAPSGGRSFADAVIGAWQDHR